MSNKTNKYKQRCRILEAQNSLLRKMLEGKEASYDEAMQTIAKMACTRVGAEQVVDLEVDMNEKGKFRISKARLTEVSSGLPNSIRGVIRASVEQEYTFPEFFRSMK